MNWYPRRPLLYLVSVWLLTAGIASIFSQMTEAWLLAGGLIAGIALYDQWRCRRMATPDVHRLVPHNLPLSVPARVRLQVRNRQEYPVRFLIHDHYPAHFSCEKMPRQIKLDARSGIEIDYRLLPPQRGDAL
ncbi:MAG: hypothetical protein PVJ14_06875, partial [Chromatiales bacterium]